MLKPRQFNVPDFGFDPFKSNKEVLNSKYGIILWTYIRMSHLADQHFDEKILNVVKAIEQYKPKTFSEFMACVSPISSEFGSIHFKNYRYPDLEFWAGVWFYVENVDQFCYRFEEATHYLTPESFI